MSRLLESSLTGKISNALLESSKLSLREQNLTEAWKYTIKAGSDLRKAIEAEDPEQVLEMIQKCCLEVIENSNDEDLIDDFDRLKNEVADDVSMENVDEDSADYWLGELYDLCDNVRVFVGLQECDEPKADETLNESKEFVDSLDAIADFMIDFDPYGFEESYDGDHDEKRGKLVQDIVKDKKTVAYYLHDVVVEKLGTEEQQAKAAELLEIPDLKSVIDDIKTEEVEVPSAEDLEADDAAIKLVGDKEIEDRIAELRLAIQDGVSEDEQAEMEKEIADLEALLNESSLNEGEDSQGALKAFSDGLTEAIRLQELRNAEEMGEFFQEAMGILRSVAEENGYMVEGEKLDESVSVATTDGSTVDIQDAASVQSDAGTVTVVTGDTTVVINNNPVEPALDIPVDEVPVEEPIEEVPAEEIIDEPVVDEEPIEEAHAMTADAVKASQGTDNTDIINAGREPEDRYETINTENLSVIKNQGNVYMISFKENGTDYYMVCEDFNQETYEAEEAEKYTNKEDADKDYFNRVGLEVPTEE